MRILVVEDEHRIANTIKKGLEQERYAVDVCYNGNDGFDLGAQRRVIDKNDLPLALGIIKRYK